MNNHITREQLENYSTAFNSDRASRVACDAVMAGGLLGSCRNPAVMRKMNHEFSLTLKQGAITNQKQSGRCWLFAATNVMRFRIIEKLHLEDFELSQNYLLFWDKLEKSNWFLENILDTVDEPVGSRILCFLLDAPVADGGQWDMMANLVAKYGEYPNTACRNLLPPAVPGK